MMIEIHSILEVEAHLSGIEAVIFDLDDTLFNERDYVRSGYRAIAAAFPQFPGMVEELWTAFEQKQPAIDAVLARHGSLDRKDEALRVYRFHKPEISLASGVGDMLIRLGETKKLGIITDGRPEGQRNKIEALGLADVPCIITDELGGVTFRKPCEASFVQMCERLGVAYDRAAYVGDNPAKDFIAPEKLGMRAIWFRNPMGLYNKR